MAKWDHRRACAPLLLAGYIHSHKLRGEHPTLSRHLQVSILPYLQLTPYQVRPSTLRNDRIHELRPVHSNHAQHSDELDVMNDISQSRCHCESADPSRVALTKPQQGSRDTQPLSTQPRDQHRTPLQHDCFTRVGPIGSDNPPSSKPSCPSDNPVRHGNSSREPQEQLVRPRSLVIWRHPDVYTPQCICRLICINHSHLGMKCCQGVDICQRDTDIDAECADLDRTVVLIGDVGCTGVSWEDGGTKPSTQSVLSHSGFPCRCEECR